MPDEVDPQSTRPSVFLGIYAAVGSLPPRILQLSVLWPLSTALECCLIFTLDSPSWVLVAHLVCPFLGVRLFPDRSYAAGTAAFFNFELVDAFVPAAFLHVAATLLPSVAYHASSADADLIGCLPLALAASSSVASLLAGTLMDEGDEQAGGSSRPEKRDSVSQLRMQTMEARAAPRYAFSEETLLLPSAPSTNPKQNAVMTVESLPRKRSLEDVPSVEEAAAGLLRFFSTESFPVFLTWRSQLRQLGEKARRVGERWRQRQSSVALVVLLVAALRVLLAGAGATVLLHVFAYGVVCYGLRSTTNTAPLRYLAKREPATFDLHMRVAFCAVGAAVLASYVARSLLEFLLFGVRDTTWHISFWHVLLFAGACLVRVMFDETGRNLLNNTEDLRGVFPHKLRTRKILDRLAESHAQWRYLEIFAAVLWFVAVELLGRPVRRFTRGPQTTLVLGAANIDALERLLRSHWLDAPRRWAAATVLTFCLVTTAVAPSRRRAPEPPSPSGLPSMRSCNYAEEAMRRDLARKPSGLKLQSSNPVDFGYLRPKSRRFSQRLRPLPTDEDTSYRSNAGKRRRSVLLQPAQEVSDEDDSDADADVPLQRDAFLINGLRERRGPPNVVE